VLRGKTIKEMTPEERREYRRRQDEARRQQWVARCKAEQEADHRKGEQFREAWEQMERTVAFRETPAFAQTLMEALGDEAKRVLKLYALAHTTGWELLETVRLASGIKGKKAFEDLIFSLYAMGALVPDWCGEFVYERVSSHFLERGPSHFYLERPADAVTSRVIEDNGYRINGELQKLLCPELEPASAPEVR
jgi:hypothetical protein